MSDTWLPTKKIFRPVFECGHIYTYNPQGIDFKVVGYRIDSAGLVSLIGQVRVDPKEAEYPHQFKEELFPLKDCRPASFMSSDGQLRWPTVKIGSAVRVNVSPQTIYMVVGAQCKYTDGVMLQLMHVHLTPTIIPMAEFMCRAVGDQSALLESYDKEGSGEQFLWSPGDNIHQTVGHPFFDNLQIRRDPEG